MKMPMINECSMMDCAYNTEKKCHALAITVGGPEPLCDTYMKTARKGGDMDSIAGVGACKVSTCVYNFSLECSSENIRVGSHGDHAQCDTFRERA
jgi:hypothetical protein